MNDNIITLSGSMKFYEDMIKIAEELSANGNIVLLPFKDPHENNLSIESKKMHEKLHEERIDMSSKLFVVNKNGYIGKSTMNEIVYALKEYKAIEFMEKLKDQYQWKDILTKIPVDYLFHHINATIVIMVEKLIMSINKFANLLIENEFNFITAAKEINRLQIELMMLFESVENIKESSSPNSKTDVHTAFNRVCNNIMNDIDIHTLIYSTPSELIDLFIKNNKRSIN